MDMVSTTAKGDIGQFCVAADLVKKGYTVLFPSGGNPHYDLVIEKDNRFSRVQVKYVTIKNGAIGVRLYTHCNNGDNYHTADDVDLVAAYDSVNECIYYMLRKDFATNRALITLRVDLPENNQQRNVRYAKDYRTFEL